MGCAIAQTSTFSHNSTTYIWSFSGAAACNGVALTTIMHFYVKNVTGVYNEKEIWMTETTAEAGGGSASVSNQISFPLVFSGTPSDCDTNNSPITCTQVSIGNVAYSWADVSATTTYNNATKTLVVSSSSLSWRFDQIALDGSNATNWNSGGKPATVTVSLSTSGTTDTIIVFVLSGYGQHSGGTDTMSDSPLGLTWHNRELESNSGAYGYVEEWYAVAGSALSSDTISAKVYSAGGFYGGLVAFGISGASTTFDSGGPQGAYCTSCSSPYGASITTANPNDLIFGAITTGGSDSGVPPSYQSPFTEIQQTSAGNSGGETEYEVVSTTQTSLSVNFAWSYASDGLLAIADAIEQASSTSTTTTTTLSASVALTPASGLTGRSSVAASLGLTPSSIGKAVGSFTASLALTPASVEQAISSLTASLALTLSSSVSAGASLAKLLALTPGVGIASIVKQSISVTLTPSLLTNIRAALQAAISQSQAPSFESGVTPATLALSEAETLTVNSVVHLVALISQAESFVFKSVVVGHALVIPESQTLTGKATASNKPAVSQSQAPSFKGLIIPKLGSVSQSQALSGSSHGSFHMATPISQHQGVTVKSGISPHSAQVTQSQTLSVISYLGDTASILNSQIASFFSYLSRLTSITQGQTPSFATGTATTTSSTTSSAQIGNIGQTGTSTATTTTSSSTTTSSTTAPTGAFPFLSLFTLEMGPLWAIVLVSAIVSTISLVVFFFLASRTPD